MPIPRPLLEQLQLFEMEHEGQPAVVARVFKLIAEDASFGVAIEAGLNSGRDWLRDIAGVVFRLHGLAVQNELRGLEKRHTKRLAKAVEAILCPFESGCPRLDGHYIGALYMQAVVPWLCAWRSGAQTGALSAIVQRTGHAICRWLNKQAPGQKAELRQRVCERLHNEYVILASSPVWGGEHSDPVWKAYLMPRQYA